MSAVGRDRPPPGIARATVFGFMGEALVFPAGLITAAYLTRTLGAGGYGELALIYAVLSPVVWVASTTFAGRAGVKLLADTDDWKTMSASLFRLNALLGAGAMVLFAVAAPWIASSLRRPDLTPWLWVAALEIGLMPVSRLHRDALMARGFYTWPAVATAVYQVARLALVLTLVAAGWGIGGVVLANLAARALELVTCRRRMPLPVRGARPGALDSMGTFLGTLFMFSLCIQLFNRIDLLMLGWLGAPADTVGHYGAAQNLALAPGLLALVFSPLLIAALRRMELAGDAAAAGALRTRSARLAVGLWALSAPVAAGATPLAVLLFGPSFAPSGAILGWLGVSGGAWLVVSVHSAHEVAAGRHWRPLVAAIPMLLVAVTLELVLIPRYGGLGAAWATVAGAGLAALIVHGFGGRAGLPSRLLHLARAAAAAAAGFVGARLAANAGAPSPLDLLAGCAVTVAVVLGTGLVSTVEVRRVIDEMTGRTPITMEAA